LDLSIFEVSAMQKMQSEILMGKECVANGSDWKYRTVEGADEEDQEIVVDRGTDDDDTADHDPDHVVAVVVAAVAVDQSHIEQNSHWRLTI